MSTPPLFVRPSVAVVAVVAALLLIACSPEAPKDDDESSGSGDGPGCATALLWVDFDEDGYGDGDQPEEACINTPGHAEQSGDCDDNDPTVNPGVREVCNDKDDDCDGSIDRGLLVEVWTDSDGDGFGDPETAEEVCEAGAQHVRDDTDCDDTDPTVSPDATEVCNDKDDDCDGGVDNGADDMVEVFVDEDGDGMGAAGVSFLACPDDDGISDNAWDCDDADGSTPVVVDSGSSGTGTLEAPLGSLQVGVDAAHALDGLACVVVQSGLYLEAIDLSAGDVRVVGVDGSENTVVDAIGQGEPVLTLSSGNVADTLVTGLTLTGGTAHRDTLQINVVGQRYDFVEDAGAGIYAVDAVGRLEDVVVTDHLIEDPELTNYTDSSGNTVVVSWKGRGAGVSVDGGALEFVDVTLSGNQASEGGAVYVGGTASFLHTEFFSNQAADFGGAFYVEEGELSVGNSIFAGNSADEGGTLYAVNGVVDLEHVTIHEDSVSTALGALLQVQDSRGDWANLIVSAPVNVGIGSFGSAGNINVDGILFFQVVDAWQREAIETFTIRSELSGDPMFVGISEDINPTNDDLHLDPSSPAVDAASSGADADGSVADLGAYGGPLGEW